MSKDLTRLRVDRLGTAQRFLVLGLGRSGLAASELLHALGRSVLATDDALRQGTLPPERLALLTERGIPVVDPRPELAREVDVLIQSPGVPPWHPLVELARQAGVVVWGELELAARLVDIPIIGVTGTNGKSTVVTLVSHILASAEIPHRLAGNIGVALCGELVQLTGNEQYLVLEVSSFQLEAVDLFKPKIACVLNIAPDHLDRYASLEEYANAKWQISARQDPGDALLVGDELADCVPAAVRAQRYVFSLFDCPQQGIGCHNGEVTWRAGDTVERFRLPQWALVRRAHQRSNGLAALAIARLAGVPFVRSLAAWNTFVDLPHRLEVVRRLHGVTYINDSKATNVHATCAALAAIEDPVVLIAGGRGKGESYEALRDAALEKVVGLVLIGETAGELEQTLQLPVRTARVSTMADAVRAARAMAEPGDTVLLSPAAASYDMFANFAERGNVFRREVESL